MTKDPEGKLKEPAMVEIALLRAKVEKELAALLAHPAVPEEFRKVFEERR